MLTFTFFTQLFHSFRGDWGNPKRVWAAAQQGAKVAGFGFSENRKNKNGYLWRILPIPIFLIYTIGVRQTSNFIQFFKLREKRKIKGNVMKNGRDFKWTLES